jgi:hypothetical protein
LIAYLAVHSFAIYLNSYLLFLRIWAGSYYRGSLAFGSVNKKEIDNKTFYNVNAGDHWSFKMSKQIDPFLFIFGW